MNKWKAILTKAGVRLRKGATTKAINAFETKTGLQLTDELKESYRGCNGGLGKCAQLFPLDEAAGLLEALPALPRLWGYFPVAGLESCDPCCVCCNAPLRGYVVQVFHDQNDAELKFRSFERMLTDLLQLTAVSFDFPHEFDASHPLRTASLDSHRPSWT